MDEEMHDVGVVELRQYTVHPGARDTLVELFDAHFVESQEALGMHVIGQFRDLDDPDRFVWIRGFHDMASRFQGLTSFYVARSPAWAEHGPAANATMVDVSNVLLLEPLDVGAGWSTDGIPRLPIGGADDSASVVTVTVCPLRHHADGDARAFLETVLPAACEESGATVVGCLVTLDADNDFPALPVRDDVVAAWVERFDDDDSLAESRRRRDSSAMWAERVRPWLDELSTGPLTELRLRPTARSALR